MAEKRNIARGAWMAVRLCLVIAAAAVAGLGAVVAAAAVTARPALFLTAGLAVFVVLAAAGVLFVTRRLPARRRRRARAIAFTASTLGAIMIAVTVLLPAGDPRREPAPVAGQRFWPLPTGSRIAYVHVPARGAQRPDPVVFIHGGPAVADMAGDAAYFGQLARDGYHVYVYDQAGTGRSSRLADPRQYTIGRAVADLEAIRARIGASRLVLIGHSWGAQVAASYLAAHGQHVARVVFSSPGALAPALDDGSDAGLRQRLSLGQQAGLYTLLARPRVLLAWTLLQVNPVAAHAFAGDAEMDARMDRVYNQTRPALHCSGTASGPALHGLGFYAHQYPQSAASPGWPDPRPRLARLPVPALVIKGGCDYLSWSSALAYRQALPRAELVYLKGAGHNAYQDQPAAFLATVRAFLTGRPLPVPPWPPDSAPPGYQDR